MEVCSHNHDVVCFTTRNCPVCDIQGIVDELEKELKESHKDYDDLEDKYQTLLDGVKELAPEILI